MIDRAQLVAAIQAVKLFNQSFTQDAENVKASGVNDALTQWFLTREDYEALDEIRKEVHKTLENLNRTTLPDMMIAQDVKTITIDSLRRRFTRSQRVSCTVQEGKTEDAHEFLRKTGNGALIKPTVNSATLTSFAKTWVQDEGQDLPEDIFKLSTMNLISATKV